MRLLLAALACVLLSGCATVSGVLAPVLKADYTLHAKPRIVNPAVFNADDAYCQGVAEGAHIDPTTGKIIAGAIKGAGDNASYGLINPLFPAVGAAGGAVSAGSAAISVSPQERRAIWIKCMDLNTVRDHSGDFYDTQ